MNHLCIRELAEIVGGRLRLGCLPPLGGEHEPIGRVALDSGRVAPGEVFWGLAHRQDNSSWRAEEAYARGALGAVVVGRRLEPWAGKFSIEVDDAQAALWRFASAMRRRFTGTLIAVAGSGLQQTAREMIDAVLRGRSDSPSDSADHDHESSLAVRLIELGEREKYSVIDLRARASGEIERLANLCCPHIGVLVGNAAGAGGCGTPTALAQSKAELLSALPERGVAVVDGDDSGLRRAVRSGGAQLVWFGGGPHCDVYASDLQWRGGGVVLVVDGFPMRLPTCEREHVTPALAAYAVGRVLEIPPKRIAAALVRYRPTSRELVYEPREEYALTT